MESTLKEMRNEDIVLDLNDKNGVGGGVEDVYREDRATEDQLVIPWSFSIASGYSLLCDLHYNKGLAFTEAERAAHYLRGLLPLVVLSQDLQEKRPMHNLRQYKVPLQRYTAMMDLQLVRFVRNMVAFSDVHRVFTSASKGSTVCFLSFGYPLHKWSKFLCLVHMEGLAFNIV